MRTGGRAIAGLIGLVALIACEDAIGYRESGADEQYDTLERTYVDGLPHGLWRYYYSNGALWQEVRFDHGKRVGDERTWYVGGENLSRGTWVDGLRDGEWLHWALDGSVCGRSDFDHGTGTLVSCYPDGTRDTETAFRSGRKHGEDRSYDETGRLRIVVTYEDGDLTGPAKFVEEDGAWSEGALVDGTYEGMWRGFHPDGTQSFEGRFSAGQRVGRHRTWYSNGQLWQEVAFEHGLQEGMFRTWYEDGILAYEESYVAGSKQGEARYWHPNGQVQGGGSYLDDLKEGVWELFAEDGRRENVVEYRAGEVDGAVAIWDEAGVLESLGFYQNGERSGMGVVFAGEEGTFLCDYFAGENLGCDTLPTDTSVEPEALLGTWLTTGFRTGRDANLGGVDGTRVRFGADGTVQFSGPATSETTGYRLFGPVISYSDRLPRTELFVTTGGELLLMNGASGRMFEAVP